MAKRRRARPAPGSIDLLGMMAQLGRSAWQGVSPSYAGARRMRNEIIKARRFHQLKEAVREDLRGTAQATPEQRGRLDQLTGELQGRYAKLVDERFGERRKQLVARQGRSHTAHTSYGDRGLWQAMLSTSKNRGKRWINALSKQDEKFEGLVKQIRQEFPDVDVRDLLKQVEPRGLQKPGTEISPSGTRVI